MTNDEIRMKIAELKGWSYLTPVVGTFTKDIIAISGKGPDGYRHPNIPKWPTDPAAALGLVEEVKETGYRAGVWQLREGYNCSISKPVYFDGEAFLEGNFEAQADTFCRAVCLSYIAWKEQGK